MRAATTMCRMRPVASSLACPVKPSPMAQPMKYCLWEKLARPCWAVCARRVEKCATGVNFARWLAALAGGTWLSAQATLQGRWPGAPKSPCITGARWPLGLARSGLFRTCLRFPREGVRDADRDGLQGANHRHSASYGEDLQHRRPPEAATAHPRGDREHVLNG